jgi:hypothetical protein
VTFEQARAIRADAVIVTAIFSIPCALSVCAFSLSLIGGWRVRRLRRCHGNHGEKLSLRIFISSAAGYKENQFPKQRSREACAAKGKEKRRAQ